MPRYWKWLSRDGKSCNGGDYAWSLPVWDATRETWVPGAWTHAITDVEPCVSGWHLCRQKDLLEWVGATCWEVEIAKGARVIDHGDKVVTGGPVRLIAGTAWDDRVARLFAASCALDVLPLYEQKYPDDMRVCDAIVAAVHCANEVIGAAAGDAARAAAGDAAWAAAGDAALAAAGDAARAAAWAAAGDAARAAAWAAARDVAWAAAWAAAGDAARAAVGDAARAAAWDAARRKQSRKLVQYLEGSGDLM